MRLSVDPDLAVEALDNGDDIIFTAGDGTTMIVRLPLDSFLGHATLKTSVVAHVETAEPLREIGVTGALFLLLFAVVIGATLVVQSTLPRFLTRGDELTVPVMVTNLSGERRTVEVELATEEGVELLLLTTPTRIEHDDDGRLRRVEVTRVGLGELDASGRRRPEPIEGSEFWLEADSVILATSQLPDRVGFEALFGEGQWLVAGEWGNLVDGLLAGGDALGLGMAGNAIVQGRHAAEQLHARFSGIEDMPAENLASIIAPDQIKTESRDAVTAARPDRADAAERLRDPLAETEQTLDAERFLSEVERCFSCGSCFGCSQCEMFCTSGCFTKLEEVGPGIYFTLTLEQCQECGKCVEVCPCGFLELY